jgi:CDP-glucose 4,6-dehydratase
MTDFDNTYKNKTILITGHTGFKGSWLALWLKKMGANVIGYALPPHTSPSHFNLLNIDMTSIEGDIQDRKHLNSIIKQYKPEMIFHLAAQPLVRRSYIEPVETFNTNIMGTVNLLDACRDTTSVRAVLVITSDKCYENKEWVWGYRENDPMGGYDPYSASKGAAELVTASYRQSFFHPSTYGIDHQTLIATCRAGNVIGGGDWSEDRLIPDIIRSIENNSPVEIRSPQAVRPWQHILDALYGYLLLGEKLLHGEKAFAEAWNFGPSDMDNLTVETMCKLFKQYWPQMKYTIQTNTKDPHEANLLKLDCSKAHCKLQWHSRWTAKTAIHETVAWYRAYLENSEVISHKQLDKWINNEKS